MSAPLCRLCAAELTGPSSTSACRRCARATWPRTSSTRGDVLPAARADLLASACWCSCRRTSRGRTSSPTTPTSRRTRTPGCAHAQRYADDMTDRLGLGPGAPSSPRWPATTATCCSTSSPGGIPVLGVEPAANVAEVARAKGIRTEVLLPGRGDRARRRRDTARPTWSPATTSTPTCRTSSTSPPACAALVKPTRSGHARVPAPAAPDRGRRVRHDLPRALPLPVAAHRPRALATAGLTVVDVRSCPRTAARCAWSTPTEHAGAAEPTRVGQGCWTTRRPPACTRSTGTPASPSGSAIKRDFVDFLLDGRRAGQRVVGYGAPGKGNTLLNHCGIRADLIAYTVDRNPHKQGSSCPGRTSRSTRSASRRTGPTTSCPAVEPAHRDHRPARYVRDWGGRLVFPIPHLEVFETAEERR